MIEVKREKALFNNGESCVVDIRKVVEAKEEEGSFSNVSLAPHETLTHRKTLIRSVFLKPKSRFGETSAPIDTAMVEEHPSPGLDDFEETYEKVEMKKEKRKKLKTKVLVELVLFLILVSCLVCSLIVKKLEKTIIWGLELWRWVFLVMVISCGLSMINWFMHLIVFIIERNFLLRKKVLYLVHGLKRSVQVFIWLDFILLTWVLVFINHGVPRSKFTTKILESITWGLVTFLIGSFLWLLKALLLKILASSFHANTLFDRIQESIFHQYVLQTLSGHPFMDVAKRVGRLPSMGQLSFTSTKKGNMHEETEVIDMAQLHKMKQDEVSAWTMKVWIDAVSSSGLSTISYQFDEMENVAAEQNKEITSEMEATAAAYHIFRNVARPGSNYIDEDDLLRFMTKEDVYLVLPLIERENGRIDRKALTDWVVKVYNGRKALGHALSDTKTAVNQLNKLVTTILIVVTIVIWLLLMEIDTTKVLVFFSSHLVLAAFVFGKDIVFVFIMHPFDVGNRCVIDGILAMFIFAKSLKARGREPNLGSSLRLRPGLGVGARQRFGGKGKGGQGSNLGSRPWSGIRGSSSGSEPRFGLDSELSFGPSQGSGSGQGQSVRSRSGSKSWVHVQGPRFDPESVVLKSIENSTASPISELLYVMIEVKREKALFNNGESCVVDIRKVVEAKEEEGSFSNVSLAPHETLTHRKTLIRSVFLKPKSRFGETSAPIDTAMVEEHPSPGLDDFEETYEKVEMKKEKRKKLKTKVLVELVLFLILVSCLVCSLIVKKLEKTIIWGLELWRWVFLVMVISCGLSMINWFMHLIVFIIERNFLLRKKVLYLVHGLKRSVQVFIWLDFILLTWVLVFINHGVPRSKFTTKILESITWGLVTFLIGSFLWLLKALLLKILASSFHANTLFDRIQESIFHQYVLQTLSGHPFMDVAKRVGRLPSMGQLSFTSTKKGNMHEETEVIDMAQLHKMKQDEVSAWTMKVWIDAVSSSGLSTISYQFDEMENVAAEQNKEITSEMEATAAAYHIFRNVARPGSNYIDEDDLLRFMTKEDVYLVLPLIERENGRIDRKALTDWVVKVYNGRKALGHALSDTKTAVNQLNKLVTTILIVVTIVIWLLLMEIDTTKVLVFFSSHLVLAAFVFGKDIVFVFIMHPFDVGNRCVIDGILAMFIFAKSLKARGREPNLGSSLRLRPGLGVGARQRFGGKGKGGQGSNLGSRPWSGIRGSSSGSEPRFGLDSELSFGPSQGSGSGQGQSVRSRSGSKSWVHVQGPRFDPESGT
ncbi:hypothetical protein G4B88_012907 [Cannabis sativa]|uniref:Mechanosensitive ion channel protein n=1 Tax=Cannabis sativa TaxID=3483 RepID=A0A7J6F552_CANSA|nr:hypothetical protein G4B88_012907 [Cannabis sativa]